nr:hypothetical protein [Rhizobium ruizarguesonis]
MQDNLQRAAAVGVVEQAEALTVPSQKLDPIPPFSAEAEDRTGTRRLFDHRFHHRRQPVNATPPIGHTAGQINSHIARRPDHAASTQAINDASTPRSKSAAILSKRPFLRTISTSLHGPTPLLFEPLLGFSEEPIIEARTSDAF